MYATDAEGVAAALALFRSKFGTDPTVAGAAPGRVNLIGEHVDYNDGFVFPLALEKSTYMVAGPLSGNMCECVTEAFPDDVARFDTTDSSVDGSDVPNWAHYLKGMCAIYRRNGHAVPDAFRLALVSGVPRGGGLSSSAALEMATGIIIEQLSGITVSPTDRALMGKTCEHEFAGVPCGIMDQLISSSAIKGKALLIDCRSLEGTPVPLDHPDAVIVIANSKVAHELSGSEYPTRRRQCYEVAKIIQETYPDMGITHLRDCTMEMVEAVADRVEDPDAIRRATHVVNEDQRTLKAADALRAGDLVTVGKLMVQSHESLRDLFEVSTAEIDALVNIAISVPGVYGSRITGGGFGGCTVTLVRKDAVDALLKKFEEGYPAISGGVHAEVFATLAGGGARVLTNLLTTRHEQFCSIM